MNGQGWLPNVMRKHLTTLCLAERVVPAGILRDPEECGVPGQGTEAR